MDAHEWNDEDVYLTTAMIYSTLKRKPKFLQRNGLRLLCVPKISAVSLLTHLHVLSLLA